MAATAKARGRLRWWVDGPSTPLLEALLEDPDGVLSGPASVARARVGRKHFYRVAPEGEEAALYIKVFHVPTGWPRLRSLFRPSKARREARTARDVRALGFEIAAPIAVGEERRLCVVRRSLLVIPERAGRDLRDLLSDSELGPKERRDLVVAFGAFARRLHDSGVDQDDFSPNNFLVAQALSFVLLDFERCRAGAPLSTDRRWTLLAKLHRHHLGVSRTDRVRLLRAYLGDEAGRRERREAWKRIQAIFWRVRRRDARRAAGGAFRIGRHVAREGGIWVVRGREGHAVRRLELGSDRAGQGWVLAHQLERLGLPALRPVRLGPEWLELAEPTPRESSLDEEGAVRRATRRFVGYGVFTREPRWALSGEGALLEDPTTFQLRL